MQALGASQHRGEALYGDPDKVDLGLLSGELHARGLGVEAQHHRLGIRRAEGVLHHVCPDPAGGAEFRYLLQQGRAGDEEEGKPGGEFVHGESRFDGGPDVGDAVREGEGDLLRGCGPGLGHVVTGNRDRVPSGDLVATVCKRVRNQPQGRCGRIDVGTAGDVFLENVVLDGSSDLRAGDALFLGNQLVQQQQDRRRRVDGHRRGDLVQRDTGEEHPHVLDRVDRHPDLPDLAVSDRFVGVVAHLGGQVERDRKPSGARGNERVVSLVGLPGGAETGVLPHCPRLAGVHGRVDAPGERVLTGRTQALRRTLRKIGRTVNWLDRLAGLRQTLAHGQIVGKPCLLMRDSRAGFTVTYGAAADRWRGASESVPGAAMRRPAGLPAPPASTVHPGTNPNRAEPVAGALARTRPQSRQKRLFSSASVGKAHT